MRIDHHKLIEIDKRINGRSILFCTSDRYFICSHNDIDRTLQYFLHPELSEPMTDEHIARILIILSETHIQGTAAPLKEVMSQLKKLSLDTSETVMEKIIDLLTEHSKYNEAYAQYLYLICILLMDAHTYWYEFFYYYDGLREKIPLQREHIVQEINKKLDPLYTMKACLVLIGLYHSPGEHNPRKIDLKEVFRGTFIANDLPENIEFKKQMALTYTRHNLYSVLEHNRHTFEEHLANKLCAWLLLFNKVP